MYLNLQLHILTNQNSMLLRYGSTIAQAETDELWAITNLEIEFNPLNSYAPTGDTIYIIFIFWM